MGKSKREKIKAPVRSGYLKCPECLTENPVDALFCCSCGHYVGKTVKCKNCGKDIPFDSNCCCYCGKNLKSTGQLSDLWIEKQLSHSLNFSDHPVMKADEFKRMYFCSLKKLVDAELSKKYLSPEEQEFPNARLAYYRSNLCSDEKETDKSIEDLLYIDCRKILGTDRTNYTKPYSIIVTATMSAGKSTFLNALAGKKISGVKSMACTSRIHKIISKPSEDGIVSKFDKTLIFNADVSQLMSDDDNTTEDVIEIGTYFNGGLGGKSIVLLDTPGINAYGHSEHRDITRRVIESGDGDLIIYVINASQSTTDDNAEHLRYLKNTLAGRRVLFIVNKIDTLRPEEGTTPEKMCELIRKDIIDAGFNDPVICPVSARTAFLAKLSDGDSSLPTDEMNMELLVSKFFFESQDLNKYYSEKFPEISSGSRSTDSLIYKCGMGWIEDIISSYIKENRSV